MTKDFQRIRVVDSHTEGEPTRVIVAGGPDLGAGTAAERRDRLRDEFAEFRNAMVHEPRGTPACVGALLLEPNSKEAAAQVIFFDRAGVLGMCVHGTIGFGATLLHLGLVAPGRHLLETPVGNVSIEVAEGGRVAVENIPSYRYAKGIEVETERHGTVRGDIAWGGNWFFLVDEHDESIGVEHAESLTSRTRDVMDSLEREGITGADGDRIDHVAFFGPPEREDTDSKNFVLCPSGTFDRSPCGTCTSAKLAALAADGHLAEGAVWHQESAIGSAFEGRYRKLEGDARAAVIPTVTGGAWITAESELLIDPTDPYRSGLRLTR